MRISKITKTDLRALAPGESKTWKLESLQKCVSARSMASSLNQFEGMRLSTSIDTRNITITITHNLLHNEHDLQQADQ